MHFMRGLVRPASMGVLRELERTRDPHQSAPATGERSALPKVDRFMVHTELIDCYGERERVPLLLPRRLMQTIAATPAAATPTSAHSSDPRDVCAMCSVLHQLQMCFTGSVTNASSHLCHKSSTDVHTTSSTCDPMAASPSSLPAPRTLIAPATTYDAVTSTLTSSSSCRRKDVSAPKACMLYVKGNVRDTVAELQSRQRRLLGRIEGQLLARNTSRVQAWVHTLRHRRARGVCVDETDVAVYNGMVEALLDDRVTVVTSSTAHAPARVVSRSERESMAVALAMHSELPALHVRSAQRLASLVDLYSAAAVRRFLDGFAAKDECVPASETCATQLACRLREAMERRTRCPRTTSVNEGVHASDGVTNGVRAVTDAAGEEEVERQGEYDAHAQLRDGLRLCERGNMDPAVVYAHDAHAIQRWCDGFLVPSMFAHERAEALRAVVQQRRLLPRRVALEAMSVWCLSHLERLWMAAAASSVTRRESADEEEGGGHQTATAWSRAVTALALNDTRRTLVDGGLLHNYAELLRCGELSVDDSNSSFVAFVESCGECHTAAERPPQVCFTMLMCPPTETTNESFASAGRSAPQHGSLSSCMKEVHAASTGDTSCLSATLYERLLALAPESAYWRTLLRHRSDHVAVYTAPCGDIRVTVTLPREHECVRSAATHTVDMSVLPILYEDEEVVVVNKPAGLATARHALSVTELGCPVTDVVSMMMMRRRRCEAEASASVQWSPPHVPREGQVHRLDVGTSGCLLMAKTALAMDSLRHQMGTSAAFSHRGKVYLALCVVLEPHLEQIPMHGLLHDAQDSKIVTHYRILEFYRRARVAWVECRIEQGKRHQIRRHLAAAGMPVMGDVEHGGAGCCRPLISRVALHARSLTFVHPRRDEGMTVCAPLPEDMAHALTVLRRNEPSAAQNKETGKTKTKNVKKAHG